MGNLAKQWNNPLALIQKKPDNWNGLVGVTSGGFLKFASVSLGARAGYINLVNTYLSRGRNTIAQIIPIYAPKGHGANNPDAYISALSKFTGIGPNEKIKPNQLFKLGLGIARVELGFHPNESEMRSGFNLALKRIGIIYDTGASDEKKKTFSSKNNLLLPLIGLGFGLYFINN
mgnify:CR=1 FL=1